MELKEHGIAAEKSLFNAKSPGHTDKMLEQLSKPNMQRDGNVVPFPATITSASPSSADATEGDAVGEEKSGRFKIGNAKKLIFKYAPGKNEKVVIYFFILLDMVFDGLLVATGVKGTSYVDARLSMDWVIV